MIMAYQGWAASHPRGLRNGKDGIKLCQEALFGVFLRVAIEARAIWTPLGVPLGSPLGKPSTMTGLVWRPEREEGARDRGEDWLWLL